MSHYRMCAHIVTVILWRTTSGEYPRVIESARMLVVQFGTDVSEAKVCKVHAAP